MNSKPTNYKLRKFGPITERRDYSVTKKSLELFDILKTSKSSFEKFVRERIEACLLDVYPIEAANQEVKLDYVKGSIRFEYPFKKITSESEEIRKCKAKGINFSLKVYAELRWELGETGETQTDEVLLGEIPYMTSGGSFIINGSEKVIVSQLIRSPGAYFGLSVRNKQSDDLFNKLEILPRIGSWLEISHRVTSSATDTVKVKIDKNKNVNLGTFLGAFGFEEKTIRELFGNSDVLDTTLRKDKFILEDYADKLELLKNCQDELFNTMRKGDRPTDSAKASLLPNTLFDKKRYNLSSTGRYMLNKKLSLVDRITNTYLAENLTIRNEDKPLFVKGEFIDLAKAKKIQELTENKNQLRLMSNIPGIDPKVVYYNLIDEKDEKDELEKRIRISKLLVYPTKKHMDEHPENPVLVIGNDPKSKETHLLISDIVAAINYYFNLLEGIGQDDDPDSLTNKRIVSVGELLEGQLATALIKFEKQTRERMGSKEASKVTAKNVTNNKIITTQFKQFFNSSKLSQFMDQINPLAEVSNKRRVTSLGPGGLNRDTAQFEVRDVHATHYGRICPIETPEGPNIGLILNYATYAEVDELGFLKTPYFKVENGVVQYDEIRYLTAAEEIGYSFAQSSVKVDENNRIVDQSLTIRRDYTYLTGTPEEIDFIEVSSKQIVSVAAAAIPFLENDDANRALMGSNMQRQAVPLLEAEAPFVATGIEADIAKYSSYNLVAKNAGVVTYVDGSKIHIKNQKIVQINIP
ncbi:hypothetical protein [Mycoplasma nasistruthionis]|uniref:hypothetical protein n=1 Tax=Mycoplasma nasistruthionis TaxID=353852 RepID=UPI0030B82402